ncbi:MAG: hypothetical protein ACRDL7_15310, partial [Gaiellaceae bacterium]
SRKANTYTKSGYRKRCQWSKRRKSVTKQGSMSAAGRTNTYNSAWTGSQSGIESYQGGARKVHGGRENVDQYMELSGLDGLSDVGGETISF